MIHPDISVIIPTLNCCAALQDTINSVRSQAGVSIQLIVVDGGSTDGTQKVRETLPDSSVFLSEPDTGIFDAMNKGIERSSGNYLYFLGAGDCLATPNSLQSLLKENFNTADIIFGNVIYDTGSIFVSDFTWRILFHNRLHHQSCLYSNRVFKDFRYDPSLKICADYELNLKLWMKRSTSVRTEITVARTTLGGLSTRASSFKRVLVELEKIRVRLLPFPVGNILSSLENLRCNLK